jgi:hypothetical protein
MTVENAADGQELKVVREWSCRWDYCAGKKLPGIM